MGWFQGGFASTGQDSKGRAGCAAHHVGLAGDDAVATVGDYIPHHKPFQYSLSTQNPTTSGRVGSGLIGYTSGDGRPQSSEPPYDLRLSGPQ